MRVAVLGGTGPFGSALAQRLVEAGFDVTIGSRDAERAATTAAEIGAARGAANAEAVTEADLVVLAVNASAVLATAAELDEAIGETPVLVVASELRFASGVAFPSDDPLSLAAQNAAAAPSPRRGRPALPRRRLARGRQPSRATHSSSATTKRPRRLALELAEKLVTGRALDAGPLAGARALEDMCAAIVNLNKRYGGHGGLRIVGPVSGLTITPVRGLPELREGDDLAGMIAERAQLEDGDVVVVAQKAISKIEGRVVRLDEVEPSARARELAGDERPAARGGDPWRGEARRPQPRLFAHHRDAPWLHLRLERRRRLECARARHSRAPARRSRRLREPTSLCLGRADRPRRRCRRRATRSGDRGGKGRPTSPSAPQGSRRCAT